MHVALIIDHERLERERTMLDRVSSGLSDLDVRITAMLPERWPGLDPGADRGDVSAAEVLGVRMRVSPWMRRARANQLAGAFESSEPDLLHAVGEDAWSVGLDVAKVIDRPVTLDVWSAQLVRRVPHSRRAPRIAGYVAPTEPIAEALRKRVDPDLVSLVPLGVELPDRPRHVLRDRDAAIALAIIGSGHDMAAHRAMLTGLARLTKEFPQIQACLELRGPHEHEIWRHARRLDLLAHISSIVDAARHRPLLTGCDVLVVPERFGQVRSLILQAMALGMPVVASDDPFLDMLVPDQTAVIVADADPDEWAEQLRRVLVDEELSPRLARAARHWVAEHHRASDQITRLAAAFEQVLSGGAHTFAEPL